MKKFNLSQIMKSAHRSYKRNNGEKSFSDCLKSAWKFAKLQESVSDDKMKAKTTEFAQKLNEEIRNSAKSTPSKAYNDLSIPASSFYNTNSTGRMGAHYVGD